MTESVKLPTEQELISKHLGGKTEPREKAVSLEAVSRLLESVDEVAGGLMSLRDSLRKETAGLQSATDRAMNLISVFEHQINLFTSVNQEMMNLYRTEMRAITKECTNEATKELAGQVRQEVSTRIASEVEAVRIAANNFKVIANDAVEMVKTKAWYYFLSALAGSFIGTGLILIGFRFF